jgi:hypothetical protein
MQKNNEKKYLIFLILSLNLFCSIAHTAGDSSLQDRIRTHFFSPDVTDLPVSDWYNPTVQDYQLIQSMIKQKIKKLVDTPISNRPFANDFLNTEFYGWTTYRMNRGDLVGQEENAAMPNPYIIHFNNDPENKKRCVICYASHAAGRAGERDYVRGIRTIIEALKKHNFDGHFIFYIGGWPSLKKGRLKYADVPYAFKPFMFEEMRDLGYEEVLWLDACCVPVKNLDPIFRFIKNEGLCFVGLNRNMPWDEFNQSYPLIMPFVSVRKSYRNIVSQVVGINMRDSRGLQLLNAWIKTAEEKVAFLQSDQPPFVFLVNELNLMHGQLPHHYFVETSCNTGNFAYWNYNPYAILYHQYDFVNTEYSLPHDFFEH